MQTGGQTHNVVVEHVIRRAGDTGILSSALPDQLEQVVDARQDVVHKDNRVKDLLLVLTKLVERDEGGVSNLSEVLDSVVEVSSRPHRGSDLDPKARRLGEGIKDAEESLGLVGRSVFVDGDVDVVVPEDSSDSEERSKEIGNDVERVVKVDGKEVLVLLAREVTPDDTRLVVGMIIGGERAIVEGVGVALGRGREPGKQAPRLAPGGHLAEERGVSLLGLLGIHGLGVSGALFGVVWAERGEELNDAIALIKRWQLRLVARSRTRADRVRLAFATHARPRLHRRRLYEGRGTRQ